MLCRRHFVEKLALVKGKTPFITDKLEVAPSYTYYEVVLRNLFCSKQKIK